MRKMMLGLLLAVAFSACKKESTCSGTEEKSFVVSNFNAIKTDDAIDLDITHNTNFSVKARGCANDIDDVKLSVNRDGALVLSYKRKNENRQKLTLEISMPALKKLTLSGASKTNLSWFKNQEEKVQISLKDKAECAVNDLPIYGLDVELSDASKLVAIGNTMNLIAKVSHTATIEAYRAKFYDADVNTSGSATVQLVVQRNFFAKASGDSRIYYKGRPAVSIQESGNAKVIRE